MRFETFDGTHSCVCVDRTVDSSDEEQETGSA